MEENRSFELMRRAAAGRLVQKDPREMARLAGIEYDGSCLRCKCLRQDVAVTLPDYRVQPPLGDWYDLILLHALENGDGAPLSNEWMPMGNMKDGLIRGAKYDREISTRLEAFFNNKSEEEIKGLCRSLGAQFVDSTADFSAVFPLLPDFPLRLNLWLADEEFPCSARLLVNQNADHVLSVEDAVSAGEALCQMLERN